MNYQLIKNKNWKEVEINSEKKQIPNHWNVNKFVKEFTRWIDHRGISPQKTLDNKQIPLLTTKVIKKGFMLPPEEFITKEDYEKRCKRGFLQKNDLILTTEAPAGNIAFFNGDEEYALGQRMIALASDTNINLYFKYLFIGDYFTNLFQKISNGSTAQGITTKVLKELELIIPNINEQLAMANIFSKQENIISNIEKLIEKNEVIFNELSEQLLSGELRLQENSEKISLYKNLEDNWKEVEVNGIFRNIPKDWILGSLNDLAEIKGGISAPKDFTVFKEDTVPFFRVSNLSSRPKFLTENHTKEFLLKTDYKTVPKNSILIAKSGESIRQKYRSILEEDSVIVGHIAALMPKHDVDFLYYEINYSAPEDYLLKDSTMPSLSTVELGNFQIFYPQKIEQKMIVNILKNQENIIQKQKNLLNKEKAKFEWLLDNLLSGNYLVKEIEK